MHKCGAKLGQNLVLHALSVPMTTYQLLRHAWIARNTACGMSGITPPNLAGHKHSPQNPPVAIRNTLDVAPGCKETDLRNTPQSRHDHHAFPHAEARMNLCAEVFRV